MDDILITPPTIAPANELITVSPTAKGDVVYDEKSDETVEITEEMINHSRRCKQRLGEGLLQVAEALAEVRDYRLYLVDGCQSLNEWIERGIAGLSRRHIFNHLRLMDKYGNRSGVVQLVAPVEGLGLRKLLAASKLPKEEFERFKRTGQIRLASGIELGLKEISAMSVKEFEGEIEQLRPQRVETDGDRARVVQKRQEVKAILRGIEQGLRPRAV
jgi:hypothetical protein